MIVKNKDQRIAVLVDVQNMYYSARNHQVRVNFKKLLEFVREKRQLIRAIAYVIKDDENNSSDFFEALHNAGFELKEKDVQVFSDGRKKGDWDLGIAMDAIRLGQHVDSIILVSGDGDFRPLVNYLQQAFGCLVEAISFGSTTNDELKEIVDEWTDIEQHKELQFRSKTTKKHAATQRKKKTQTRTQKKITQPKKLDLPDLMDL